MDKNGETKVPITAPKRKGEVQSHKLGLNNCHKSIAWKPKNSQTAKNGGKGSKKRSSIITNSTEKN